MQPSETDQLLAKIQELESTVARRTDQLIASTGRAYSFLDSINKGFLMCDISGELVLSNDALARILDQGGAPAGARDIRVIDGLLGQDLVLLKLIKQCIETRQTFERDNINFGKRILHAYITPLVSSSSGPDQELLGVIVLIEDLTEQKMLDRSKDEFLSIASHELRTPLTAIRGNTSIIQKYYAESLKDPELSQMIDDIHESSIRLIGVVNDFLDLAALEQGKIEMNNEVFSVNEIAEESVRELASLTAAKGLALVIDPSLQAAPTVTADKRRIKQVIINLIGNAIKFTEKGGVTLSATADDRAVRIAVTDSGRGMAPENQKLLFRKFQQAGDSLLTRDTSKGTGLGLYISKLIIESSGGTLQLERSELGVGSTFAFTLPRG